MKKKILLLALVALLAASSVFAGQLFQIGLAAQYQNVLSDVLSAEEGGEVETAGLLDIENYKFGADVRVNLLFLNVSGLGLVQTEKDGDNTVWNFDTSLTAGFTLGLGPVRATVGVGPNMMFGINGGEFSVDGQPVENFMEVAKASPLVYRGDLSINLGSFGIGASYMLNSETSLGEFDFAKLLPDWSAGKVSIALLFNLF